MLQLILRKVRSHVPTLKRYCLVLTLFIVLTVVMTYPLAIEITSLLPGSIDIFSYLWIFWYTTQFTPHILDVNSIFYTNYVFYPDGVPVIAFFSTYNQVLFNLMAPLLGVVVTSNILYLSSFILSGFGAYLLCKHITREDISAIVAGIIFAFCPYHFDHALVGHMGAMTMQWIPFCVLFLLKTFEDRKIIDTVLAAVFFILVAMSDQQYTVFTGIFLALLVGYQWIIRRSLRFDRRDIGLLALFSILSLLVIVPLNYGNIMAALSSSNYLKPGSGEAAFYSADLLNFLIPSVNHPIIGDFVNNVYYNNAAGDKNTWEGTVFIGFSTLALVMYGAIKERTIDRWFWMGSAAFFALLSLGPILHVHGQTAFFGHEIPLPFSLLAQIVPGLSNTRTPGRFEVITALSIAVLAGIGLAQLRRDLAARQIGESAKGKLKVIVPALFTMLILFEYLAVPFATTSAAVPDFYNSLAKEPGDFAVIEIPATVNYTTGIMVEYYQTVHNKKMVGGQLPRMPETSRDFELNTPVVYDLTYMTTYEDVFRQDSRKIGASILSEYEIRYIIIHKKAMSQDKLSVIQNTINKTDVASKTVFSDDDMTVYKVKVDSEPFVKLGHHWSFVENRSETYGCWMSNNGTIEIYPYNSTHASLSFTATSFIEPRELYIYADGQQMGKYEVPPTGMPITIDLNLSGQRKKELLLYTPDEARRPCDYPVLNTTDDRLISIDISRCSIKFD